MGRRPQHGLRNGRTSEWDNGRTSESAQQPEQMLRPLAHSPTRRFDRRIGRALDAWYNFCYTFDVKTAISIPDNIFLIAERVAHRLGMSRSQLYVNALRGFLEKHHKGNITQRLNGVYRHESSALEPDLKAMQTRAWRQESW
jgi:hypothetical protein